MADHLFHRDPHWVGADVASSVALGGDRILWLFFAPTIRDTGTGLGFEQVGWTAIMIENPDADPSA